MHVLHARRWTGEELPATMSLGRGADSGAGGGFAGGCWPKVGSSSSLLLLCYFSSPLSLLPSFFQSFLSPSVFPFIEKNGAGKLLLVRLQSRNGWSAIDAFGGGGGEEREVGRFFKNGFCLLVVQTRGRRKMNSVVQNDTVLAFLFFCFFFSYMKRRRFG